VELHRPGAGPQLHLVVSGVFWRERRVGQPSLQGELGGRVVGCMPGAFTGRSVGSVSSPGVCGFGALTGPHGVWRRFGNTAGSGAGIGQGRRF